MNSSVVEHWLVKRGAKWKSTASKWYCDMLCGAQNEFKIMYISFIHLVNKVLYANKWRYSQDMNKIPGGENQLECSDYESFLFLRNTTGQFGWSMWWETPLASLGLLIVKFAAAPIDHHQSPFPVILSVTHPNSLLPYMNAPLVEYLSTVIPAGRPTCQCRSLL